MAVYFINSNGMHISRSTIGLIDSNQYNVQVGILHGPNEGYKLSFDGEIIREQLPLNEFIVRLIEGETIDKNGPEIHRDIQTVINALNRGKKEEIEAVARWLDHRYSNLIRNGKIILMQHTYRHSYYSESIGSRERSIQQSQPMTTDEAYQKSVTDDEVYYTMIK
jgi:hypothetical protein